MAGRKRVTREPPERGGPIRRAGMGSSSASQDRAAEPVTPSSVVDQGLRTARMMARVADATVKGVVERSVDTAYTVIDEYMTRGRNAAGRRSQRTDGRNGMSQDPQFSTPWGPSSDLMAPWWQMMRMWAEGMAAFMSVGPGPATAWLNAFAPGGTGWAGSPSQAPRVEVRVSSKRTAVVTVSLQPGADSMQLTADPPAATGNAKKPPPLDITFESLPGVVRVSVTVPDDQPADSYTFTIRDRDHCQRGELRVDVVPES
jgi:hypothetical protein